MSRFLNTCKVEDIDGNNWRLIEPVRYESDLLGGVFEVPVGFVTDFASIPQLVQNIISQHGLQDEPAVVHDYLYATQTVPKKIADKVLYEAMLTFYPRPVRMPEESRFSFAKRCISYALHRQKCWIMYQAVNWFGLFAWRSDQKKYGLKNPAQPAGNEAASPHENLNQL